MKLLVCGGRAYNDKAALWGWLDDFHTMPGDGPIDVLIHGNARGADNLAGLWAYKHGIKEERYPAQWATHGVAAGPIRNKQMLDEGQPDLAVAFPGGRGTAGMVSLARAAGVRVVVVEVKT